MMSFHCQIIQTMKRDMLRLKMNTKEMFLEIGLTIFMTV